jgi:hypothetical protein
MRYSQSYTLNALGKVLRSTYVIILLAKLVSDIIVLTKKGFAGDVSIKRSVRLDYGPSTRLLCSRNINAEQTAAFSKAYVYFIRF